VRDEGELWSRQTYGWWINSEKFHGFQDAQHHPAIHIYSVQNRCKIIGSPGTGNLTTDEHGWGTLACGSRGRSPHHGFLKIRVHRAHPWLK